MLGCMFAAGAGTSKGCALRLLCIVPTFNCGGGFCLCHADLRPGCTLDTLPLLKLLTMLFTMLRLCGVQQSHDHRSWMCHMHWHWHMAAVSQNTHCSCAYPLL